MMKKLRPCLHAVFAIGLLVGCDTPVNDPNAKFIAMADSLIARMSVDEKISQLHFNAPAIPHLGLEAWNYWGEALHGVARYQEATVFPQVIGLGSTWDPEKIVQMSTAIATEARVFHNKNNLSLTFFSPTVNVARDPRWGRTEETYSEDPYLTGQMGVAFVKGMQQNDSTYMMAAATAKHFVADNSEFHRGVASSYTDMRDLREYYFPAFKALVQEGKVASVMATYRGLNGIPNCANKWLLNKVLRKEWGFKGYVVSDCWAISDIVNNQQYVSTNEDAVRVAVEAGTDLNCGDYYQKHLKSAYDKGYVSEQQIDTLLRRVLASRFKLGDIDSTAQVPYDNYPDSLLNCQAHQQLALDLARESVVLMKNENNTLPLDVKGIKSIAVIGAKGEEPEYGGYTGFPNQATTILQGIQQKVGAAQNGFEAIKAERFTSGSYINKKNVFVTFENGEKSSDRTNHLIIKDGDWIRFENVDLGNGANGIKLASASKDAGGIVEIHLDSRENAPIAKVEINNSGDWNKLATTTQLFEKIEGIHDVYLTFRGKSDILFHLSDFCFIPVNKDYRLTETPVTVKYAKGCKTNDPDESGFEEALSIARTCEKVIFIIGSDLTLSNEGWDPAKLTVPETQEKLLQAVYAVNPNVVLVLATGYPMTIRWEKEYIPAILGIWYGGQAQGEALADVLFGDYNPGGKLPHTWYTSEDQLPAFDDYRVRYLDRTYWYFKGDVLYPFGHGLSYTTFKYDNFKTSADKYSDDDVIKVSIDVTNTGTVKGDEVVQLYFKDVEASIKVPNKKLIGFRRVTLEPGQTQAVTFEVAVKDLGFWSIKKNDFLVETGMFDLMVGSSSADIRATHSVYVKGQTYEQGIIRINAGGD